MNKDSKILIVGHGDVIENSLFDYFKVNGFAQVFSSSKIALDATIQPSAYAFFSKHQPDYVFLSSTRSGGILANQKNPGEFIYHNLESQSNIIHAAYKFKSKKLLYFTGSCAYPKESPQPIKEEYLLTGPLEPTSEAYSVAKIAGTKLCQAYRKQYGLNAIVAVPATIYGPGADIDPENAHVVSALIAKFYEAKTKNEKQVMVFGSGNPRREFLYVDDFVSASLFLMEKYESADMINMGCGSDISIKELAAMIKEISGFQGEIAFDSSKPDGTMKKLMDNTRIKKLGWSAKIHLKDGITKTYQWYEQMKRSQAQ